MRAQVLILLLRAVLISGSLVYTPRIVYSLRNDMRRNGSAPTESDNSSSQLHDSPPPDTVIVTPSAAAAINDVDSSSSSSSPSTTTATTRTSIIRLDDDDDDENVADANQGSINIVEPDTENGSIVIQKPEYLRISWTTENKKYRYNPAAASASNRNHNHNHNHDNWMEKSTTTTASSAEILNATKLTIQSTEWIKKQLSQRRLVSLLFHLCSRLYIPFCGTHLASYGDAVSAKLPFYKNEFCIY